MALALALALECDMALALALALECARAPPLINGPWARVRRSPATDSLRLVNGGRCQMHSGGGYFLELFCRKARVAEAGFGAMGHGSGGRLRGPETRNDLERPGKKPEMTRND
ncbi:hypothetical protein METBIDRAFT_11598 [Metschnikowia bicuspidata var. bicuspidata NRRL YB-4993]|uniref:Secreted protein n=1 Tax=Metschnikowia bicuspidata var. bicuspidata NRRL YB-4993 TaxID=869754 RepID=A0A1A0HAI1_9ASCO|nr:hypothetical protein METBIDRAFT_11598 [Metschnikowia bicuspidata var. bicuspidata NRRL YB-4993]OBA21010.1 hypothetical protein METBIDRAFT_11598 [Metschnikowia bicuspidata var. bicuspidata NRRL YB-4993]